MSFGRFALLGRIGVRVFLVAVAAMLLFRQVEPSLTRWAYDTFSLEFDEGPDLAEYEGELVGLVEQAGAEGATEGASARLDRLGLEFQERGTAFFVMDRDGHTVYRSVDLQVAEEEDFTPSSYVRLFLGEEQVGMGYTAVQPFPMGGRPAGFVVTIDTYFHEQGPQGETDWLEDYPALELDPEGDLYLRRELRESRDQPVFERFRHIRLVVDVTVAVLIAVILGLFSSLFLSRRLVKLSRQTRRLSADGLPGPFEIRGRDEITDLARSMNAMRDRIAELLAGLEARDTARTEWVAQVSHDLRTPLTALRVCIDRLESDPNLAGSAAEALHHARHDTLRLQALTEDLVESARLEVGSPLNLEPVFPREVLRDALLSVRPLADERGIILEQVTGGQVPECEADGERLLRAAENLLRNAVRHATSKVEVGVHLYGGHVVLFVRDDGAGFAGGPGPVEIAVARSSAESGEGARLGLLVVERVAGAHGGGLLLSNLEPCGAEAALHFPLREPPA